MKSTSWVIIELGAALVFLATVSFFFTPAYEKGVWSIMGALILAFGNALGVKSGGALPQQVGDAQPGQSSQTTSTKTVETQAEAEPPKV